MGLLIDDLVKQVLEQTRVVANGPVLARREPLRVDVIPGGGAGGQMKSDALAFVLDKPQAMEALRLTVAYEVRRGNTVLQEDTDYVRIPKPLEPESAEFTELLSLAFFVKPKLKLKAGSGDPLDLDIALPVFDHELRVKLTVTGTTTTSEKVERTIVVPFTVPDVEFGLPVPGAICICAAAADLALDGKFLVMLPPGSPDAIPQIVASYNEALDALNALEPVLGAMANVVKPLEKVVGTLKAIPTPYVTTDAWVKDFHLFDSFDDEMTSFLLVAPTGWGVQFSDTANMGDWDDVGGYGLKTYKAIDVLQLPGDGKSIGDYVILRLGLDAAKIVEVRDKLVAITGLPADQAQIGFGVLFVHDLADPSVKSSLRTYDTIAADEVNDDTESARWTFG